MQFGLGLGMSRMHEQWHVVRGKDGLTHWLCVMVDAHAHALGVEYPFDPEETTWCGQTFFDRLSVPATTMPITCLECAARQ